MKLSVTRSSSGGAAITACSDDGERLAVCSVWRNGAIGQFEAQDAFAAAKLLAAAEDLLREWGCSKAIGPMDGDTWHRYRFVTRSNGRAPFLLEPQNPPEWPEYFVKAGWGVAARYTSSEIDLARPVNDFSKIAERLQVTIRKLKPEAYDSELRRIYDISVVSFQNNFLYVPVSFEAFVAMYAKVEALVIPEFSLIAETPDGESAGFVFALPDGANVIVKTLAVLPERRFAGLGSVLVEQVHQAARELGFKQAIHALQHQKNSSLRISSRHDAKVFREYTLYEKYL
ncbi:MAG: GNAT superfamily N-acetyltransferase [Verrucomicrobiales bacterium]|jgi:GNAT superfamily N-acetyltransferase